MDTDIKGSGFTPSDALAFIISSGYIQQRHLRLRAPLRLGNRGRPV